MTERRLQNAPITPARARVLVVGAGGLGAPLCEVLARSGVGTIGVVDDDRVDLSNLQRQVLYATADIGEPKAVAAARHIRRMAPACTVVARQARVDPDNARELLAGWDVVCDGTDSLDTKFLLNDTCVALGVPFVVAGILRFSGQAMTVLPGGACYRCLFEEPPPADSVATCAQAGVLGAMAGVMGAIQAAEVLRIVRGEAPALAGAILVHDALEGRARRIVVPRNPTCRACGAAR